MKKGKVGDEASREKCKTRNVDVDVESGRAVEQGGIKESVVEDVFVEGVLIELRFWRLDLY